MFLAVLGVAALVAAWMLGSASAAAGASETDNAKTTASEEAISEPSVEAADTLTWDPRILGPGAGIQATIPAGADGHRHHRLRLPEKTTYVRVEVRSDVDVDLRLAFDKDAFDQGNWHSSSSTYDTFETLELLRNDDPSFEADEILVCVNSTATELPTDYVLTYTAVSAGEPEARLAPGASHGGILSAANGHRCSLVVDVPDGTSVIRLDLHGADQDLDLYAGEEPFCDTADAPHGSASYSAAETLLLSETSDPPLVPGRPLFVVVQDAAMHEVPIAFQLSVSDSPSPPKHLTEIPDLNAEAGPLRRTLSAVVALHSDSTSGSGTIVHEDGWILSAAHLADDPPDDGLFRVAVTLDERKLPRDLFRARLIATDEDRDLALLRIVQGPYGSELPPDLKLPVCPPNFEAVPSIGDAVTTLGYPGVGGIGTITPISLSKGVVSGFDIVPGGVEIKTDALVAAGSSGGALLDERLNLVGILLSAIDDSAEATSLGYAAPVTSIPAWWRRRISR